MHQRGPDLIDGAALRPSVGRAAISVPEVGRRFREEAQHGEVHLAMPPVAGRVDQPADPAAGAKDISAPEIAMEKARRRRGRENGGQKLRQPDDSGAQGVRQWRRAGYGVAMDALRTLWRDGGNRHQAAALIPDALVDDVCVCGPAAACPHGFRRVSP